MKRRTFIKGLGIALLAPTMLLTKEAKAEVPSSNYRPMPDDIINEALKDIGRI
ncbi:hypothetical protein KAR91_41925 [Candidatus Pacearchaeota archaeon]|nr:hypothetical protein [Candidatus Pacearchaeota archaeon]